MFGEICALVTAILRGFTVIPLKQGLRYSNVSTSSVIYLTMSASILWAIVLLSYPIDKILSGSSWYFVMAGMMAPGIGSLLNGIGVVRLGVPIASAIVSTGTLFSVVIAVAFQGERVSLTMIAGIVAVVVGTTLLSVAPGTRIKWRKKDLLFPFVAAALFGTSTNFRKFGLQAGGNPIIGAMTTSSVSLVILCVQIVVSRLRHSPGWTLDLNRNCLRPFLLSGLVSTVAYIFYFVSLYSGSVVHVQPISSTNPLFTLIFARILLRDEEEITLKIIVSSILIVLGVVLISV